MLIWDQWGWARGFVVYLKDMGIGHMYHLGEESAK